MKHWNLRYRDFDFESSRKWHLLEVMGIVSHMYVYFLFLV